VPDPEQTHSTSAETLPPDTGAIDLDIPLEESAEAQLHETDTAPARINGAQNHLQSLAQESLSMATEQDSDRPNGVIVPRTESTNKRHSSREVKPIERFAPEASNTNPTKQQRAQGINGTGKSTSPEARRTSRTPARQRSAKVEVKNELVLEETDEETDEETKRLIEQFRLENLHQKGLRRRS